MAQTQARSEDSAKGQSPAVGGTNASRARQKVECHRCKNLGHYARDCPSRGGKSESPGQSTSRLAALTATPIESGASLDSFSVEQLEQHLAQCKLGSESTQMQSNVGVGVVISDVGVSRVVGPTPL